MKYLIYSILLLFSFNVLAEESVTLDLKNPRWDNFNAYMIQQKESDSISGLSYMVSGGIAIAGGLIGYYSSDDIFAKAVYSVAQSVGIAAIGYGSFVSIVGNENSVFYETLKSARSLTNAQRDDLVKNYVFLGKERERKTRIIKAVTHGLVALLNGYNGYTATSSDLRTALYFVAGVNALASISFTF